MRLERLWFFRITALAVCGSVLLGGCATHSKKKKPQPDAAALPAPRRVGTVALVNQELGYVLLDVGTLYMPSAGTALKSFTGETESGILAVDPEKRGPFIVADIVKGEPKVGDQVEE